MNETKTKTPSQHSECRPAVDEADRIEAMRLALIHLWNEKSVPAHDGDLPTTEELRVMLRAVQSHEEVEWSGLIRNPHCNVPPLPNDVLIDWNDFIKLRRASERASEVAQPKPQVSEEMKARYFDASLAALVKSSEAPNYDFNGPCDEDIETIINATIAAMQAAGE